MAHVHHGLPLANSLRGAWDKNHLQLRSLVPGTISVIPSASGYANVTALSTAPFAPSHGRARLHGSVLFADDLVARHPFGTSPSLLGMAAATLAYTASWLVYTSPTISTFFICWDSHWRFYRGSTRGRALGSCALGFHLTRMRVTFTGGGVHRLCLLYTSPIVSNLSIC